MKTAVESIGSRADQKKKKEEEYLGDRNFEITIRREERMKT